MPERGRARFSLSPSPPQESDMSWIATLSPARQSTRSLTRTLPLIRHASSTMRARALIYDERGEPTEVHPVPAGRHVRASRSLIRLFLASFSPSRLLPCTSCSPSPCRRPGPPRDYLRPPRTTTGRGAGEVPSESTEYVEGFALAGRGLMGLTRPICLHQIRPT